MSRRDFEDRVNWRARIAKRFLRSDTICTAVVEEAVAQAFDRKAPVFTYVRAALGVGNNSLDLETRLGRAIGKDPESFESYSGRGLSKEKRRSPAMRRRLKRAIKHIVTDLSRGGNSVGAVLLVAGGTETEAGHVKAVIPGSNGEIRMVESRVYRDPEGGRRPDCVRSLRTAKLAKREILKCWRHPRGSVVVIRR